jgi:formate hydrogenlyase subunit 3/multisubunit Na+/H+ antiporter MnhD subunit
MKVMPVFTIVFLIAALSSMGMPALNGFIGEITILQGAYQMSFNWAFWGAVGIALGAAYLIWLFQRTMLGEVSEKNMKLRDLSMARDRRLRAVDRLGLLDRPESAAVLPRAGAAGGADRGARAAGILRGASFGESAT